MSASRRHHIIAQMIQRRFVDEDGLIFLFDKRRPRLGILRVSTTNAFVERDLNTAVTPDGVRDASLETAFSALESEAKVVTDKIIDRARARKTPRLTPKEREIWDFYFYCQQKRAPDVFHRLGFVDQLRKELPAYIEEYERDVRPLTPEERAIINSAEGVARIIQNTSVRARSAGGDEVMTVLGGRGLAVAVITRARKSFILGDHPLARFGGRLDDPASEVWMPIAPDVAVSPWQTRERGELLSEPTPDDVRRCNRMIFENSNVVASSSETLLRSLAGLP